ncbi:MAG: DUF2207 domain-containing protein [Christensenellaceae bacterium]
MKKYIQKIVPMLIVMMILLLPALSFAQESGTPAADYAANSDYVIKDYQRTITVHENNVYDIADTMTVDFVVPAHGLRVDIPQKAKILRNLSGKEAVSEYNVRVSNLHSDQTYHTDTNDGVLNMYIGNSDEYIKGVHTYNFGYTFDPGDDRIDDFDEFYFNIVAPTWNGPIEKLNFTVHMPKAFDAKKIGFTTGAAGNTGYNTQGLKFSVKDNTITGTITQPLAPHEGLTMRIELPNGYYVGARTQDEAVIPFVILFSIVFLIMLILFLTFKKNEKIIKTVEFNAPQGMNSADVGFIIDGIVEDKDVVSLLIYWADKGNIEIHEEKKNMIFKKIAELPEDANDYETIMFDKMFERSDTTSLEAMQYHFFDTVAAAKARIRIKYETPENRIFSKKSLALQSMAGILAPLPTAIMAGVCVYADTFEVWVTIMISAIVWLLGGLLTTLYVRSLNTWYSQKLSSKTGRIIGWTIATVAMYSIIFMLCVDIFKYYALFAIVYSLAMTFMAPKFRRRTPKGVQWAGQILGLKNFIETVEEEKLKMMVNDDPAYFYSILPYAYVLGVTDKWAKKFESIAVEPPSWYYGYNGSLFTTILFTNMLVNSMNRAHSAMMAKELSNGGIGGMGGMGGGSGFGGGGFSGGGFGGGGGSW